MALDIITFEYLLGDGFVIKDEITRKHIANRIHELVRLVGHDGAWSNYRNFWPPTIINALRKNKLVFFMGAGTSAASEYPTWRALLEQRFGVPKEFIVDDDLKNDNLTLGEIASRRIGREQLQAYLRATYDRPAILPTAIHYSLAALGLPLYITTNYDTLFESAWKRVHPTKDLAVVCNADDAEKHTGAPHKLYKLHGCASRDDELLVLTRSEYRQHYRSNRRVLDEIKVVMGTCPTVFAGFSHTDPEVGRLIDDVIFKYEYDASQGNHAPGPDLYNMQFENTYVTNERFAAKGMVSLTVRLLDDIETDSRTGGIAESVAELVSAMTAGMDGETSVDVVLKSVLDPVKTDLVSALDELEKRTGDVKAIISSGKPDYVALTNVLNEIDMTRALATQGVYVIDADGSLVGRRYVELDEVERDKTISAHGIRFAVRPYFQKAKSYRRPFVSDFFESQFNGNSTFAVCVPLVRKSGFLGLLFSACQIGQWLRPIEVMKGLPRGLGMYILDGQGLVAIPPNGEFGERVSERMANESVRARTGFDFMELKILSKKDKIIGRLAENIIPIEKDDDILSLDKDLEIYARIQNFGELGWRCAISRAIKFTQ